MPDAPTQRPALRIARHGGLGRITLDRPRAINALTAEMIVGLADALERFAADPALVAVLVDGAGDRGLCAGGDIRAVHDAVRSGQVADAARFFRDEYRMNAAIAAYPKPYIAFMDGIVMGGGVGISAHGSYRIVTERTRLAMPETGIGFFPDIGGTWLLGRLGPVGLHLALTSEPVGAADAIALGLADRCVPAASLSALAEALSHACDRAAIEAAIATFAVAPGPARFAPPPDWIASYAAPTLTAILAALDAGPAPAAAAAAALRTKSPTALAVTLRALRDAAGLDLGAALAIEYRIAIHAIQQPDFLEGVRAALIDKDRTPRWHPDRLDAVTPDRVAAYFTGPDPGGPG